MGCMRGYVCLLSSLCSPAVWSWWWWYPAGDKQSAAQAHARRALSTFQYHRQVGRD